MVSLTGYLFVAEDMSSPLTITEVVKKMEEEVEKRMADNKLISYAVFYHSAFNNDNNHSVAENVRQFKAISLRFKAKNRLDGYADFPYSRTGNNIKYKGFKSFSRDQNSRY